LSKAKGDIYIQPHDFPDPDAVASSFGLSQLLNRLGYSNQLLYYGFIQRQALNKMISQLNIPLRHASSYLLNPEDIVILVDGQQGNRNMTESEATISAFIDHHEMKNQCNKNILVDNREDYGSCATIITEYWKDSSLIPDENTATALGIGIARDTDSFKRMVHQADLEAFTRLWPLMNQSLYYDIIRNNLETEDRLYYRKLMNTVIIDGDLGYMMFPSGCPVGMMGILGDFLLSMNDVKFSFLGAQNGDNLNLSIRSELPRLNAAELIQTLLKGIGWGGGHDEMAGGIMLNANEQDFEKLVEKLKKILKS